MKRISWKQLDACKSANEVASLLRKAGVKGYRTAGRYVCPLEKATGWIVLLTFRYSGLSRASKEIELTQAERTFVRRVDDGVYPDLMKKEDVPMR